MTISLILALLLPSGFAHASGPFLFHAAENGKTHSWTVVDVPAKKAKTLLETGEEPYDAIFDLKQRAAFFEDGNHRIWTAPLQGKAAMADSLLAVCWRSDWAIKRKS